MGRNVFKKGIFSAYLFRNTSKKLNFCFSNADFCFLGEENLSGNFTVFWNDWLLIGTCLYSLVLARDLIFRRLSTLLCILVYLYTLILLYSGLFTYHVSQLWGFQTPPSFVILLQYLPNFPFLIRSYEENFYTWQNEGFHLFWTYIHTLWLDLT